MLAQPGTRQVLLSQNVLRQVRDADAAQVAQWVCEGALLSSTSHSTFRNMPARVFSSVI